MRERTSNVGGRSTYLYTYSGIPNNPWTQLARTWRFYGRTRCATTTVRHAACIISSYATYILVFIWQNFLGIYVVHSNTQYEAHVAPCNNMYMEQKTFHRAHVAGIYTMCTNARRTKALLWMLPYLTWRLGQMLARWMLFWPFLLPTLWTSLCFWDDPK